jgi:hypothetical protein
MINDDKSFNLKIISTIKKSTQYIFYLFFFSEKGKYGTRALILQATGKRPPPLLGNLANISLHPQVILQVFLLLFLYSSKNNVIFKITIEFVINYY